MLPYAKPLRRLPGYLMTARAAFKQADVERACKGVRAAGLPVARVEVVDGKIVVIIGEGDRIPLRRNPLDRLHAA